MNALFGASLLPALVTIAVISVFDNLFPERPATMEEAEEAEPIRVGSP
jgi:hypothetical protein